MAGASVLGVYLQSLPPDRRVAMARVASLIRRAARGVRESKRHGLVFYELSGAPLFALESKDKSLTLYIAEPSVTGPFAASVKEFDAERNLASFSDLNRLPLPEIEKLVRASVVVRRDRGTVPNENDLLTLWGVNEEQAKTSDPYVRIPKGTAEEAAAQEAARLEQERLAAEAKKILKPTKHEKSLVEKRAEAKAAKAEEKKAQARATKEKAKANTKTKSAAKKETTTTAVPDKKPKKEVRKTKAPSAKTSKPAKTAGKKAEAKKTAPVKKGTAKKANTPKAATVKKATAKVAASKKTTATTKKAVATKKPATAKKTVAATKKVTVKKTAAKK